MAVSTSRNVNRVLYPQARVGPMGEIGFWSVLTSIAGDASGGNSVSIIDFPLFTDKLGFSLGMLELDTSTAVIELAQVVMAYRGPNNESLAWLIQTIAIGGPSVSSMPMESIRQDPRLVYYPLTLRDPSVLLAQPNISVISGNVNGVTNTVRAFGYIFPHMIIQQQPTAIRDVAIRP